jgi:hypothetical protein
MGALLCVRLEPVFMVSSEPAFMVSLSNHEGFRTIFSAALHGSSLDRLGMKRVTMKQSAPLRVRVGWLITIPRATVLTMIDRRSR